MPAKLTDLRPGMRVSSAKTARNGNIITTYFGKVIRVTEKRVIIECDHEDGEQRMVTPESITILQSAIPEPDHSDDDTKPLEPIQPEPLSYPPHACNVCGDRPDFVDCGLLDCPNHGLAELDDTDPDERAIWDSIEKARVRHDYKLAYRTERLLERLGDHGSWVGIEDANTEYIPIDLCIAAHESYKARPDPFGEVIMPFIVRTWYKRLLDAQKRLSVIPLDDNAGFNDAVLDFKLLKARYMSIAERFHA